MRDSITELCERGQNGGIHDSSGRRHRPLMLAGAGYVPAAQRANSSAILAELRTRFGEESLTPDP